MGTHGRRGKAGDIGTEQTNCRDQPELIFSPAGKVSTPALPLSAYKVKQPFKTLRLADIEPSPGVTPQEYSHLLPYEPHCFIGHDLATSPERLQRAKRSSRAALLEVSALIHTCGEQQEMLIISHTNGGMQAQSSAASRIMLTS
jgi:hypothetical protein